MTRIRNHKKPLPKSKTSRRSPKREFRIGQDVAMVSNPAMLGHVSGFDPDGSVMVQWSGSRTVTGVSPSNLRGLPPGHSGRRMSEGEDSPDAEAAGAKYAQEQLDGSYFMDWVREQLAEAAELPPDDVLPLETEADARVIAKNMLQQLEWDTKRELEPRSLGDLIGGEVTRENTREFYKGFSDTLRMNNAWLAEELLALKGEMRGGVSEARARRSKRSEPVKDPFRDLHTMYPEMTIETWMIPGPLYRAADGLDGVFSVNKITGDANGYVVAPFGSERIPFSAPGGKNIGGYAQQALNSWQQDKGTRKANVNERRRRPPDGACPQPPTRRRPRVHHPGPLQRRLDRRRLR